MRVLIAAIAAIGFAQAPTFRTTVERVQLDVSATRNGRPVAGLGSGDFIVTDNGAVQEVETAVLVDLPLSVQLVLDTSGSVSGSRLQHLISASQGLLDALQPGDHAGLITFSAAVEIKATLTADIVSVKRLLPSLSGAGSTTLRDATELALGLSPAPGTRLLVLIFTDGNDTSSWLRNADVVESARRSGVVVHIVENRGLNTTSALVTELTDVSGGRVFSASSEDDLTRLFTRALDEMRARYLLTFTPRQEARRGWHELKVRAKPGGIDIKARPGYFVAASESGR